MYILSFIPNASIQLLLILILISLYCLPPTPSQQLININLAVDILPPLTVGKKGRQSLMLRGHDNVGCVGIEAYDDRAVGLHNFLSQAMPVPLHFSAIAFNKKQNSFIFQNQSDVEILMDDLAYVNLAFDGLDESPIQHGVDVMRYFIHNLNYFHSFCCQYNTYLRLMSSSLLHLLYLLHLLLIPLT